MNRTRRRLAKRRRALRWLVVTVFDADRTVGHVRALDRLAKSFHAALAKYEDAPAARAGEGWDGEIEGFCPVKGLGHVDGFSWYFRARWEEWRFEVYDAPFRRDVGGRRLPDADPFFEVGGEADGDASWMPFSKAWRHIESSIAAFRAREATQ